MLQLDSWQISVLSKLNRKVDNDEGGPGQGGVSRLQVKVNRRVMMRSERERRLQGERAGIDIQSISSF